MLLGQEFNLGYPNNGPELFYFVVGSFPLILKTFQCLDTDARKECNSTLKMKRLYLKLEKDSVHHQVFYLP